tara:strand:+ start:1466 stop:1798 length:333 start_codon:yes stop_codon:yes gene_type:complete
MATLLHNISGELTTEILTPETNISVKGVSIANTHANWGVYVDLYVGTISKRGVAAKTYYIYKGYLLPKGENLHIDFVKEKCISFPKTHGLFIKLTKLVSDQTPTVDVIIS